MKYWLLALCVALLSACGGGGGGGSVSMEPPTDSAALMRQLADARTEITEIPENRQTEYERKITELEQDLHAARASVDDLMAQLEIIRQEMQEIKISSETPEPSPPEIPTAADCHAEEKVLIGDSCQSCEAGEQFNPANNTCEPLPPTAADCHADNQILVGDSCQNCSANMQFSTDKCIPTAASCHANNQVLVGDSCQSCSTDMLFRFSDKQCVAKSTMEEMCNANGMRFYYLGSNFYCQQCRSMTPMLNGNECIATLESCHAVDRIFNDRFTPPRCRTCPSDRPRKGNVCSQTEEMCIAENKVLTGDVCVPKAATCHANRQIVVGTRCQSCPEDMRFRDNQCVVRSEFDTEEYRANRALEYMGAYYAYERGYFGQGVTVVNVEKVLASHEDLRANVLTMDINLDYSDIFQGNLNSATTIKEHEYNLKYKGDRFAEEYLNFLLNDLEYEIDELSFGRVFHGTATGGIIVAEKNDIGGHGVAPQAKLIPIPGGHFRRARYYSGDPTKSNTTDLQYIIDNKIPIVNHSIWLSSGSLSGLADYELVKDSDSIFVWSSGNNGSAHRASHNNHITLPLNMPDLEDNWLIVLGYYHPGDSSYGITCGDVKRWCVSGPPQFHTAPIGPNDDDYKHFVGTSASAPAVSGALALLKSAAPEMPMTVIRAILLTTATDIGDPGIDEVYGWGFVNISAGITLIESMETEAMAGLSAVSFDNLRGELPSGFAHMHDDFSELSIAIKLTDNLHYNIGLGDMMAANNDAPEVPLGDGATDMLADAESDSRRGFFAYGDIDSELGLRYYGGEGGFSYVAEGQHAKTNQRFFAGDFGSLGGVSGKVYSGKVGFTRDMNMAGMQIFGDYERAAVGGDGNEGNLIVGVRDAQAESWMAGMSFADIWKYGDKIRLSARQEMGLSGGDLIVRYPHAVGDFHETFIGEGAQEIEVREAFLPLKQKALMLYTAGYSQKFTAKSEWAAALEYNAGNNAKALSLIWQGEF